MTLLQPHDDTLAHKAPVRHANARSAPPVRRRALSALLALVGLLVWSSLTAPQIVALAPQFASLSLATTRWVSDVPALARPGLSSGVVMGSLATPQACTTSSASALGSNLVVPSNAWVCGDAMAVGGNVIVLGHVQGSAQVIGGNVVVSGEVDGDVTAVGGDITVQPGAITRGKLESIGGRVTIAPGANAVAPARTMEQMWYHGHSSPTAFHALAPEASSFWLGLLFWISAAVGLTAFIPEAVGHVRYTIARRFLLSGVAGAIIGAVGALLGVALFLTCLGIPVTLAIGLAMWIAWVIGTVAFGSWLGATLLRGMRHDNDPSLLASTVIGVILLSLLKSLPIAGPVVSLIVGCVGLGAAALTLLSARRVSYARLRW